MKSETSTWFTFYVILVTYAFIWKLMVNEMAKKVMKTKQWPPPDASPDPSRKGSVLDSLRQPLFGEPAIKTAKRYVIMADVFLWCVAGSFVLYGLFFQRS